LALVTGAAHRLGRAFALTLGRRGYALLLHYFNSADLAAETAEQLGRLGVPAQLAQADLTQPEEIESLVARAASLGYAWKVLVNSAAIMPANAIDGMPLEEWNQVLALNLSAPLLISRRAAQFMTDGGSIVNVTDAGAGKAWTGFPAYSISKAALESLTRLLAKTYAPRLRVNAVAPGLVMPGNGFPPQEWERLVNRLPLQHSTPVEDVTGALEYLLDNESVTGQILAVDGGYSLL